MSQSSSAGFLRTQRYPSEVSSSLFSLGRCSSRASSIARAVYRFRNIGGGSVGAVAAAFTAAAELGRDGEQETTGFDGMKNAQSRLAEEKGLLS
jgi:hypothetical protein